MTPFEKEALSRLRYHDDLLSRVGTTTEDLQTAWALFYEFTEGAGVYTSEDPRQVRNRIYELNGEDFRSMDPDYY